MDKEKLHSLLQDFKNSAIGEDELLKYLSEEPYTDIDFAKIDNHRALRKGTAEVIYGAGKSAEQIQQITQAMLNRHTAPIIITRLQDEKAHYLNDNIENFHYSKEAHLAYVGCIPQPKSSHTICIICAGTSDIAVAEEAALTAELLGNKVNRLYDVGVAGLHRLLDHIDDFLSARVVICIAGMEGALPSVVAGLCKAPVIAVPTSIGYGTSFNGITALLAMLNSCASGISVVNIDNGFGAAYQASLINQL